MSIRASVEKLEGYVPGEQPKTGDVIKLNTNENPYPPSPAVIRAFAELDVQRLRTYPDPVSDPLRAKIADLHGCGVANVFSGNGSDEILALCTRAFVENDGSIGYFIPSYSLYPVLAEIRDVAKRPVSLDGRFGWRMESGYEASLFFLCSPNAPTGMLFDPARVREFCAGFNGVVVVDEAYVDFSKAHCMDMALELENVLVLRTLSKSYSLAGLRVGYVVGPEPLVAALFKIKDSYNLDMISQELARAALDDQVYTQRIIEKVVATRARLSAALEALDCEVYPSEANFVWVRPRKVPAKVMFEELRKKQIMIRYFPGERTGEYVRITVGTDEETDTFLKALKGMTG